MPAQTTSIEAMAGADRCGGCALIGILRVGMAAALAVNAV